jgi:DNA helicase-2/ATP-dependent DNA helicase PcrA
MTDIKENFKLSEDQAKILQEYNHGYASVLATPGAGKTTIITHLIKKFITEKNTDPRSILVLTLTESAAREFKLKTLNILNQYKRYPEFSTIHSFCNRVLSRFYGYYNDLTVLPDAKKNEILEKILLRKGFRLIDEEAESDTGPGYNEIDYLELFRDSIIPIFRRDKAKFDRIKEMVHLDLNELRQRAGSIYNHHLKCFYHIPEVVEEYENFLRVEKFIDFDMMINETFSLLKSEPKVLNFLRARYTYILEDEAQDSNNIQGSILSLLAGPQGNYIRVGDPNQSIFTTFTGADYRGLMDFYNSNIQLEIKQSNRSNQKIIDVSNYLVDCYTDSFPSHHVKIQQGGTNPSQGWVKVREFADIKAELREIADQIDNFLKKEKNITLAILTRTNSQATEIYKFMTEAGFDSVLHGNRDENFFNNQVVVKITTLIGYILNPHQFDRLEKVLSLCGLPESTINEWFSDPDASYAVLKSIAGNGFLHFGDEEAEEKVSTLCRKISRLSDNIYSPVSEILELINNLFIENIEEKAVARLLHQMWLRSKPGIKNLNDFYAWLLKHANSKIKQELLFEEEENFSSPGIIHILTVHKAKGLQWDAVFLPNYSKWDYKDESWKGPHEKKDIRSVIFSLLENIPRNQVRQQLAAEEVKEGRRVAYVGLTRPRKYLYISYAREGLNQKKNDPSDIFCLLKEFQEKKNVNQAN